MDKHPRPKIYYVVNARIPHTKAYAVQVMHMQEALARVALVEMVVPARFHVGRLHRGGRLLFALGSLMFMLIGAAFFLYRRLLGERFIIYTVDMDTFSGTFLPYLAPTYAEMHSPKKRSLCNRLFFSRVRGVIATTVHTKESLTQTFGMPVGKVIVEPNGVTKEALTAVTSKAEARQALGLPLGEAFALYVGRFYAWKGLEVLPAAAGLSTLPVRLVGGTKEEFEKIVGMDAGRLQFEGSKRLEEVPLWLAAADVLVVVGTARNEDSYYYTSPMKMFEYLAARRPVVAARTPALTSLVPETAASWYEPDNAASLAQAIERAQSAASGQIEAGYALASEHSWGKRAERILAFIRAADSLTV